MGRAGLTVTGLPLIRARYMVEEMGTDPIASCKLEKEGNYQPTGSNSISAEVTTQVEENSILSIGGNCGELPLQGHDFELG